MKILSMPAGSGSKTYLYKDGTQYVQFDNGTHNVDSQYKTLYGGATLNPTSLVLSQPPQQNACATITTTAVVDLTNFNTLYVKTNEFGTLAVDVSAINQSAYIGIGVVTWTFANNSNYEICVNTVKDNFGRTPLAILNSGTVLADATLTITEISLK